MARLHILWSFYTSPNVEPDHLHFWDGRKYLWNIPTPLIRNCKICRAQHKYLAIYNSLCCFFCRSPPKIQMISYNIWIAPLRYWWQLPEVTPPIFRCSDIIFQELPLSCSSTEVSKVVVCTFCALQRTWSKGGSWASNTGKSVNSCFSNAR